MGTGFGFTFALATWSLSSFMPILMRPVSYQETELRPYVQMFSEQSQRWHHPVDVSDLRVEFFRNLTDCDVGDCEEPHSIIGFCEMGSRPHLIAIDFDYWETSNFDNQFSLIFHELGHCYLGRHHRDDMMWAGSRRVPVSLMHSTAEMGGEIMEFYDHYLDELFSFQPKRLAPRGTVW